MTSFEMVRMVIQKYIVAGSHGLFSTRNWFGDPMDTIYEDHEVSVGICWSEEYFEVLGLSEADFEKLEDWYELERKKSR